MIKRNWPELKEKLSRSKFRSSFHLKEKDIIYVEQKGLKTIRDHAESFIRMRLAPENPNNDGKQTPYKGHPVFIAEHATAFCCRSCAQKWHGIEKNRPMSEDEIEYAIYIIMSYIEDEIKSARNT